MARKKKRQPTPPAGPVRIFEAELASGPSGAVLRGAEIDVTAAIARRQAGENVVVCGGSLRDNRKLAQTIEAGVGPYEPASASRRTRRPACLAALSAGGPLVPRHSFYETEERKAGAKR